MEGGQIPLHESMGHRLVIMLRVPYRMYCAGGFGIAPSPSFAAWFAQINENAIFRSFSQINNNTMSILLFGTQFSDDFETLGMEAHIEQRIFPIPYSQYYEPVKFTIGRRHTVSNTSLFFATRQERA